MIVCPAGIVPVLVDTLFFLIVKATLASADVESFGLISVIVKLKGAYHLADPVTI